jgi:two-component system, NarL family, sensor histidine kinase UhpB
LGDAARAELKAGRTVEGETTLHTSAGDSVAVSYTLAPHIEPPGEFTGVSAILHDITERRRADEARRQQELLQALVDIQEDERRRIARDLHDHIGQQATGVALGLANLVSEVISEDVRQKIREIQAQIVQMDRDISFLAFELRPHALATMDLSRAIENFADEWARNYRITTDFHGTNRGGKRLASDIETNLYRIAQETLNNICKHAQASKVSVILDIGDSDVKLIIEDDGVGFDVGGLDGEVTRSGHGMGLVGMRERTILLGGELEIESAPGEGTTVFVRIPARFA